MILFKSKLKKYFIILAISYIAIRLLSVITLSIFPGLLSFEVSKNNFRSFSIDFLIAGLDYLMGIVFLILLRKDLKIFNLSNIPLLILTVLSPVSGIALSLLILFFAEYQKSVVSYENNY